MYTWLDQVLKLTTIATAALATLMVLGVIVHRIRVNSSDIRIKRAFDNLVPHLVAFLAGEREATSILHEMKPQRQAAEQILLHMLGMLAGENRDKLVELAKMQGLVNSELGELRSGDWTRRELAAMNLGIIRLPETVPYLARLLYDRHVPVRYTAARSLAMVGSVEAFASLVDLIAKPKYIDTARLLEIVQQAPRANVEPIQRMIENEQAPLTVRLLLVDLTGDWREYRLVESLRSLLRSNEKELVIHAIKALVRIGDIDSVPEIIQMVDDPRWEVRSQVVKAAGLLGFTEALPLLRKALTDEAFWVRRNAAESLVALGPAGYAVLQTASLLKDRFAFDLAEYQLERLNGHLAAAMGTPAPPAPTETQRKLQAGQVAI